MGHGKQLTEEQQGQIKAWAADNHSQREIARRLGCNKAAVSNNLKDPDKYGKCFKKRRPSKITASQKRRLLRTAASNTTRYSSVHNPEVIVGYEGILIG
jgi:IS30 family transposase